MVNTLDKELLVKLMENSRTPIYKLAQELGVSRQTLSKRLKKLEQEFSLKYTAIPDLSKLGLNLKAYIMVRVLPSDEARRKVESKVKKLRQITQAHYIYGHHDMLIEVLVKDRDELSKVVDSIHKIDGVVETETFIVREVVKYKPSDPIIKALKQQK
ncbi:MAG: Lrp/AsnC family transcriptional regulator [Candidatus Nezhaarchaeales archaeon]